MSFSTRLKTLMKEGGCTQMQLAAALSVTQGSVFKWLHGSVPQGDKLFSLASYFNVEPTWMLTGEGSRDKRVDHYMDMLQESPANFQTKTHEKKLSDLTADLRYEKAKAEMAIKLLKKQKGEIDALLEKFAQEEPR